MARAAASKSPTRIQREKTEQIMAAALEVFSTYGFRGSTIDQIAATAGLSKPNLLYYFDNKETIHAHLLERLLITWLAPLKSLDATGEPIPEILAYVDRKLQMSREYPRESRLFANELLQGAPRILDQITGPLKTLVDEKAAIIENWSNNGQIAKIDPYHLIFSIWSTTQHYADFDVQIGAILGPRDATRYKDAGIYLKEMFTRLLRP